MTTEQRHFDETDLDILRHVAAAGYEGVDLKDVQEKYPKSPIMERVEQLIDGGVVENPVGTNILIIDRSGEMIVRERDEGTSRAVIPTKDETLSKPEPVELKLPDTPEGLLDLLAANTPGESNKHSALLTAIAKSLGMKTSGVKMVDLHPQLIDEVRRQALEAQSATG